MLRRPIWARLRGKPICQPYVPWRPVVLLEAKFVFTYVDEIEFAPGRSRSSYNENAQAVAAIGKPYMSRFDPNEIANDLMRVGLELVEDLDGKGMWERYAGDGATILQPPASLHIVLARVGSQRLSKR